MWFPSAVHSFWAIRRLFFDMPLTYALLSTVLLFTVTVCWNSVSFWLSPDTENPKPAAVTGNANMSYWASGQSFLCPEPVPTGGRVKENESSTGISLALIVYCVYLRVILAFILDGSASSSKAYHETLSMTFPPANERRNASR